MWEKQNVFTPGLLLLSSGVMAPPKRFAFAKLCVQNIPWGNKSADQYVFFVCAFVWLKNPLECIFVCLSNIAQFSPERKMQYNPDILWPGARPLEPCGLPVSQSPNDEVECLVCHFWHFAACQELMGFLSTIAFVVLHHLSIQGRLAAYLSIISMVCRFFTTVMTFLYVLCCCTVHWYRRVQHILGTVRP